MKGFRQKVQFKGSSEFNFLVKAAEVIIPAGTLSFSAAASCSDGNNGGFNPPWFLQPAATIRVRHVPLYGWSPSRPRALCNMEKEAALDRGAPSGWPQKGSFAPAASRPANFTTQRPEAAMASHRKADLTCRLVSLRFLFAV